jgi:hypothetical protein
MNGETIAKCLSTYFYLKHFKNTDQIAHTYKYVAKTGTGFVFLLPDTIYQHINNVKNYNTFCNYSREVLKSKNVIFGVGNLITIIL